MDEAGADGRGPAGGPPRPGSADGPAASAPLVELNALLGRGTRYAGKLHFDGRVRIEGRFEGEIRGEDVLVIGDGAEIDGDIEVGVCIVTGGTVRAQIRARDAIELHAPAIVHGDLHAPNVFIDRGVQFEGNCTMAPLDDEEGGEPLTASAAAATDRQAELASRPVDDEGLEDDQGVEDEPTREQSPAPEIAGLEGGSPQPERRPPAEPPPEEPPPGPDDAG